jgi:hypothetical protein
VAAGGHLIQRERHLVGGRTPPAPYGLLIDHWANRDDLGMAMQLGWFERAAWDRLTVPNPVRCRQASTISVSRTGRNTE